MFLELPVCTVIVFFITISKASTSFVSLLLFTSLPHHYAPSLSAVHLASHATSLLVRRTMLIKARKCGYCCRLDLTATTEHVSESILNLLYKTNSTSGYKHSISRSFACIIKIMIQFNCVFCALHTTTTTTNTTTTNNNNNNNNNKK
jgi:hypothetical protein